MIIYEKFVIANDAIIKLGNGLYYINL